MKLIFYSFFILTISINSIAQSLTGIVYELNDKNEKIPLIGTNVFWNETQIGTTTDANGVFMLRKVKDEPMSLIVSYIGYKPDTVLVPSDQENIEIVLSVNRELQEVVVAGTSLSKFIDELDAKQTEVIKSKELLKAACCNRSESFTTNASVDVQF